MAEEELNTYKLQLQQVEAALTTDPTNEELITLKGDLEQVINLTKELIGNESQEEADEVEEAAPEEATETTYQETKVEKKKKSRWGEAEPKLPIRPWQVGERCQAVWDGDSLYHDAIIKEIDGDSVSVEFVGYRGRHSAQLSGLKMPMSGATTVHATSSKRELEIKRKEYLKEKKRKKQEKLKDLLEAKEKEKGKWQSFSSKAFGKKGFVKKSIFKSPLAAEGKVGVGTCGQSGKGMTDYTQASKYKNSF